MELNVTRDNVCINETVYDSPLEQSVELDAILPDYCPSIFQVLSCRMTPKVSSCRASGDKVFLEGTAHIRVLYISEENNELHAFEQKMPFSKTVELKCELSDPVIRVKARTDYVNCRVVNPKRLDIRGAVTLQLIIMTQRCEEVICDAQGGGIQMKKQMVNAGCPVKSGWKQFTVEEELELSYGKPPILEVLNACCSAMVTDYKIIANKVIVKGELRLHILYRSDGENAKPEVMEHTLPVSQIMDLEGVDEEYLCHIQMDAADMEIQSGGGQESDGKTFHVEFTMTVCCEAYKNKEIPVIADLYSTQYETEVQCRDMQSEKFLSPFEAQHMAKDTLELPEDSGGILDLWCEVPSTSFHMEETEAVITGTVCANLLALNGENTPVLIQKEIPFEHRIELKDAPQKISADVFAQILSCAYSLIGANSVEVRAELKLFGCFYESGSTRMTTGILLDEENPKPRTDLPALTLYFADKGELVWDIAKRYNTSPGAILEENGLDCDEVKQRGMILIPLVD